ncbi:hypothetical protein FNJ88_09570 [Chryseobacterium sp. SNU WT5]|uniref:LIC_10190 family membrane protein n=1 Tax=Chryseobacterium sp. SNU WT5 TaxID=2594269 RepID=UPI00117C0864|nr:hypothetical protein [Chryseobacterium sp. SNU WT5]QDP85780.1 hypothetical protein FNJ88_09570 [Chryseobacterium sp. SNU WT5]
MLYIAALLIMLLPALLGIGALFQKYVCIFTESIALQCFTGIFTVTVIWAVLAFFIPLDIAVEVSTLVIGLLAFFYFKVYVKLWKFLCFHRFLFLIPLLIIVFFGSYYPFILDHFGYYVPTISWLSEVGLVQGISNLDLLLGQMSLWHIFQAGFSNFTDPFLRINVLVLVVYLIYLLENKSWIHFVFLPFLFLFSQSPSTDLPVTVFSLIILNEMFRSHKDVGFLLALSVFVFAIKPTMIWLPIFVFLYSILIAKNNWKFILPGTFIMVLFLFKNVWTFGFPIFPVQIFDFGFLWKPNPELLQNSSELALRKTYDMQYSYLEIIRFSSFDYIKNWFFLKGIKSYIHILFLLSVIAFLIFALCKKSKLIWLLFISIFIKTILVLLFSAQYRFFFDVFFVMMFVFFYRVIPSRLALFVFTVLSVFFFGFLSFPRMVQTYFPSFKLGNFISGVSKNQLIEPAHFKYNKYKAYQLGNLKFNVVDGYVFSFDTPIPAISPQFIKEDLDAGVFPQLKGKTVKEGFVWRKITSEEKEKLRNILKDFR